MSSPTPNDLTRQQLDELDALLQRMLSLPVTAPGEPAPAPFVPPPMPDLPPVQLRSWRADPPAVPKPHLVEAAARKPVLAAVGVAVSEPEAEAPPSADDEFESPSPTWDPVPIIRSMPAGPEEPPQPVVAQDEPVETTGTLRGVDAPAVPFGFRSPFADDTPVPLDAPSDPAAFAPLPLEAAEAPAHASSVPPLLWPLFAANWLLESLFCLFGGAAITRPMPKYLLGVVGLVLLVAAGAWSARGMGWIALPWPR